MINKLAIPRQLKLVIRVVFVAVSIVVIFIAFTIVYSRIDKVLWTVELTAMIGHPLSDLLKLESSSTSFYVTKDQAEIEEFRERLHPPTDISVQAEVVVAYRHVFPGMWAAMIFLNADKVVTAVHVGGFDHNKCID